MFKRKNTAPLLDRFLSMEMIAFQNDDFGRSMEREVNSIFEKYVTGEYARAVDAESGMEVKNLEKLIFKRLGAKVTIITDDIIAAVIPLYPNKHSILLPELYRGVISDKEQDKLINEMKKKDGWVDTNKAKLGGVFTQYNHKLFLNFKQLGALLRNKADYAVAIILHELGHVFHGIELSDRLSTNNQVLANVASTLSSGKAYDKKDYIFRELKSINLEVTEKDIDDLLSDKRVVPSVAWFDVVIGSVTQQLSDNKYDETSFEQLADGFAARFGYGKQILSALESIYRVFPNAESNRTVYMMQVAMDWIWMISVGIIIGVLILGGTGLGFGLAVLILVMNLILPNSRLEYKTYDDLRFRYKRLRQQHVARIKEMKLSKSELKQIIEEIHTMDDVVHSTQQYRSIFTSLSNFLIPTGRKAERAMAGQQLTEELVMNDLFVKSAELKVIS